jgi:SpoVK/Ycf46/Vps4 family AAA+-type ATPase
VLRFGESQKLIKAIFTLAAKLSPTIVFIDEIDLFLRKRQSGDHEATSSMKGEFMQLWDGLIQQPSGNILVLGATNRPYDLDDAVLRRMPRQFFFDLPGVGEREQILRVQMREVRMDEDVDLTRVAEDSDEYSGSDLKEVCRYAVMMPIREVLEEKRKAEWATMAVEGSDAAAEIRQVEAEVKRQEEEDETEELVRPGGVEGVRSVRMGDFLMALTAVAPTGRESLQYMREYERRQQAARRP